MALGLPRTMRFQGSLAGCGDAGNGSQLFQAMKIRNRDYPSPHPLPQGERRQKDRIELSCGAECLY
jgi:hypothetical protein